jgi:hypothetical protein
MPMTLYVQTYFKSIIVYIFLINNIITFIYIKNKVKIVISPEELWYYHCTLNQHFKWYPKTFLMCLLMHDYNTF